MLEKAQIKILDDIVEEPKIIDVMFNPEDYTVSFSLSGAFKTKGDKNQVLPLMR